MELRTIEVFSACKVLGLTLAGMGALGGLMGLGIQVVLFDPPVKDVGWFVSIAISAFIGLGLYPALCFLFGAGLGAFGALVFNLAARWLGGLRVELAEEANPALAEEPGSGGR